MGARIYLGSTPPTVQERLALRERAVDLIAGLKPVQASIMIGFGLVGTLPIDLAIIAPGLLLTGLLRDQQTFAEEAASTTLTAFAQQQRAMLCAALPGAHAAAIAAIVITPTLAAESEITLDIDDHRARVKILGFDELVGMTMLAVGDARAETPGNWPLDHAFAARLWHDGARFLFPLMPAQFQLRLAHGGIVPLYEGETILGRRRSPRRYEHRITCTDDDLISTDHATLTCLDDETIMLRDMSKNGTRVTRPGEREQQLHNDTTQVTAGTKLNIGSTTLVIEPAEGDD